VSISNLRGKSAAIAFPMAIGLLFTGFSGSIASADSRGGHRTRVIDAYGKLPLSFEANQGQTDKQVKFLSRGPGYALFLTPTETVLSLTAGNGQQTKGGSVLPIARANEGTASKAAVLRIRLQHANSNPGLSASTSSQARATTSSAMIRRSGSAIFRPSAE
jgi:hypothetical protein